MAVNKFKRKSVSKTVVHTRGDDLPSLRDLVPMIDLGKDYKGVRVINGVVTNAIHRYPLFKKDGEKVMSKWNKEEQATMPRPCLAWDAEQGDFNKKKKCPYCERGMGIDYEYFAEVIDRDLQEMEPKSNKLSSDEKSTGYKDMNNSSSWTPVVVMRMTPTVFGKIQKLEQLNKHKVKGTKTAFPIDDPQHGCDVSISYDEKAAASDRYSIQKGDPSALSEEEENYLTFPLEHFLMDKCTEDYETAKKGLDRISAWLDGGDSSDDEDDDSGLPEKGDVVTYILSKDQK